MTRRPRPSLDEAMPELRAEETRLREEGVSGAQQSTSVLASGGACLWSVGAHAPPSIKKILLKLALMNSKLL